MGWAFCSQALPMAETRTELGKIEGKREGWEGLIEYEREGGRENREIDREETERQRQRGRGRESERAREAERERQTEKKKR